MSDTSVEKIKGIASYYKGTQEEILNIPVHLIDPDGIFVESNTGEMWTGIQIIKIKLDNEIEPVAEDEVPTVFGARREVSDVTTAPFKGAAKSHVQKLSDAEILHTKTLPSIKAINDTVSSIVNKIESGLIRGARGYAGVQGPIGVQGYDGTPGTQGFLGTQGLQGEQGVQGAYGTQGSLGTQGCIGTQGEQGPVGEQGLQGLQEIGRASCRERV